MPVRAPDQRLRTRGAGRLRELEALCDPPFPELVVRPAPPHAGPNRGLQGQFGIRLRGDLPVRAELERLLHRSPEGLALVVEGVYPADRAPELRADAIVRLQLEGLPKECEGVFHLVARGCQSRRSPQPDDCLRAKPLRLRFVAGPDQVGIL